MSNVTTVECMGDGCPLCVVVCNGSHDVAMRAADDELWDEAYEAELNAAKHAGSTEPTRSVLYRSAACLALEAGRPAEAAEAAREGLKGEPPAEIAQELREALRRAEAAL